MSCVDRVEVNPWVWWGKKSPGEMAPTEMKEPQLQASQPACLRLEPHFSESSSFGYK